MVPVLFPQNLFFFLLVTGVVAFKKLNEKSSIWGGGGGGGGVPSVFNLNASRNAHLFNWFYEGF